MKLWGFAASESYADYTAEKTCNSRQNPFELSTWVNSATVILPFANIWIIKHLKCAIRDSLCLSLMGIVLFSIP